MYAIRSYYEVRYAKHNVELASMAYFDFTGEVEISVTYNKGDINEARRITSYNVCYTKLLR